MPDSFILFMFAAKDRFVRKAGDRLFTENIGRIGHADNFSV